MENANDLVRHFSSFFSAEFVMLKKNTTFARFFRKV